LLLCNSKHIIRIVEGSKVVQCDTFTLLIQFVGIRWLNLDCYSFKLHRSWSGEF